MPTGAVPVATSRPRGRSQRWVFRVVQAMAGCRQTALVAIAPVAEVLEPAVAAAPEVAVHMNMPIPTGPSRPAPCLVAPATSTFRRSAWRGRCRNAHHNLGRLKWRGSGPHDTSNRRSGVWARRRGLGGSSTSRGSFLLWQGHFLGLASGRASARGTEGLGRWLCRRVGATGATGGIGRGRGRPRFVGLPDHSSSSCIHDCVLHHAAIHICVFLEARGRKHGCRRRHRRVALPIRHALGGVHRPVQQPLHCSAEGLDEIWTFHLAVLWVRFCSTPPASRLPVGRVAPWRAETTRRGLLVQIDPMLLQAGHDIRPIFCLK